MCLQATVKKIFKKKRQIYNVLREDDTNVKTLRLKIFFFFFSSGSGSSLEFVLVDLFLYTRRQKITKDTNNLKINKYT